MVFVVVAAAVAICVLVIQNPVAVVVGLFADAEVAVAAVVSIDEVSAGAESSALVAAAFAVLVAIDFVEEFAVAVEAFAVVAAVIAVANFQSIDLENQKIG